MESFISFELAKKLKEKGYAGQTDTMYKSDGRIVRYACRVPVYESSLYPRPTISQALKWLREENGCHIEISANASGYLYVVSDVPSRGGTDRCSSGLNGPNDGGTWDKWEDCALGAIEYVLNNLI